ncbi:probable serine/threonine-protein kinase PLK [Thalassophryne amazonica]|uniref:probable serine/threonine-protein kinase PLK n=1 Tax=Thalassophryne amazonica TaxID=390379 RepID=UPI0014710EE6|nr:probable serine/threonine-protein kinase PLK [Thalassophryne amazonica]
MPKYATKRLEDVVAMVAKKVHLRTGVRRLYTLDGRLIEDPKDLKSHEHYVAVGRGGFKPVPYNPEEPATCKEKSNRGEAASPAVGTAPRAQDVREDARDVKIRDEGELKKIDLQEEPPKRRNTFVVPLSAVEKIRAKPIIVSRHDRREKQEDFLEKDTPTKITQPEKIRAKHIIVSRQARREKQEDSPEKDTPTKITYPEKIRAKPIIISRHDRREKQDSLEKDTPTKITQPEKIRAKPIIVSRQDRREKQEDSPEKDTPTEIRKPEKIRAKPIIISRHDRREKQDSLEKDTPTKITQPEKIRAKPIIVSRHDRREKQEDSPEKDTPTEFTQSFKCIETHLLGKGGFGRVYAGYVNDMKVAIKYIPLDRVQWVKRVTDGKTEHAPLEGLLMAAATAGRPVGASTAVSLLAWQIKDNELLLMIERPYPCCNLAYYVFQKKVLLEKEAKYIMHQLVFAAADLHAKGLFHRDIKLENILIEKTRERRVRIIDFGVGTHAKEGWYKNFAGTWNICPPECQLQQQYRAVPFTMWQLGVVMYELLGNDNFETKRFLAKEVNMNLKASKDCQDFMDKCLCVRPEERPDFEQLMTHP